MVSEANEGEMSDVDAALGFPQPSFRSWPERCSDALVAAQWPEDGLEGRDERRKEGDPDFVESEQESFVRQRRRGGLDDELGGEGEEPRREEIAQLSCE